MYIFFKNYKQVSYCSRTTQCSIIHQNFIKVVGTKSYSARSLFSVDCTV